MSRLSPPQQPANRSHHLFGLLFLMGVGGAKDAVGGMLVEQSERNLVKGGLDCGDLREHVDAVPILVDHLLDAADLALNALQARAELILGGAVAARRR